MAEVRVGHVEFNPAHTGVNVGWVQFDPFASVDVRVGWAQFDPLAGAVTTPPDWGGGPERSTLTWYDELKADARSRYAQSQEPGDALLDQARPVDLVPSLQPGDPAQRGAQAAARGDEPHRATALAAELVERVRKTSRDATLADDEEIALIALMLLDD